MTPDILDTPAAVNGDTPTVGAHVIVPVDLANRILGVLGNMPYIQVHEVVDALRAIPVQDS